MEDIKFHKFICYILNCIDTTKQVVYVNDDYYVSKPITVSGATTFK